MDRDLRLVRTAPQGRNAAAGAPRRDRARRPRLDEAPAEAVAEATLAGVARPWIDCLGWTQRARLLRARIAAAGLRAVSDAALLAAARDWLLPFLGGIRDAAGLARLDPFDALGAWLGWEDGKRLAQAAPAHYVTPLGRKVTIDYAPRDSNRSRCACRR